MRSGWLGRMRKTVATTLSSKKKFDVIGSGFIPCNKIRWRNARLVLCRPGYGIVSLEFKDLDIGDRRDERDENGKLIDCKVRICEYGGRIGDLGRDFANGDSYSGIIFYEVGTYDFGFSKRSWPSGDLRELVPAALKDAGWPTSPKRYYLLAKQGDFWDRPYPKGYKRKET